MATIPSIAMIPSGYKASKLYSVLPTDGSGDLTVVRATTATRVNSSGVIEEVLENVPRLDYTGGGCPSLLVEPQRTNLLLNSVWAGGGTTPTSWFAGFQTGTCTPVTSIKNTNATAYRFITSTQRQEFSQFFAISLNQVISFSVYVESITTAIIVSQMLRIVPVGAGTGTTVFLKNNVVISGATNIEAGFTYSIVLTCTAADSFQFRVGSGVLSNITGDFVLSMPQLEVSSYSTSFIPTTIQTITRNADVISKTGLSSYINSSEGVLYWEGSALTDLPVSTRSISLSDGTTSNSVQFLYFASTNSIRISIERAGVLFFSFLTLTSQGSNKKIALVWNGTNLRLFVNGSQLGSALTSPSPIGLNKLALTTPSGTNIFEGRIKNLQVYKTALTDEELTALTTL